MSNYPYNPYGYNPQQYQEQYRKMQQINNEKREFRRRSMLVALGAVIFVVIGFVLSIIVLKAPRLLTLYRDDTGFSICIDILISVISLFSAYLIARALIDRNHNAFIPLALPSNKRHALLLIPFGVMMCLAGGYATMYMNNVLEDAFGVTFTQPETAEPQTVLQLILYLVGYVLVPCIFEEIALRAGALEAMRKYGDWFAIFTSSFVFALLHGNMVQTPFAFIAGMAIGYIYVATGSIWPGVIIHFINNLFACLSEIGGVFSVPDDTVEVVYGAYVLLFGVAGLICFFIYLFDSQRPALNKDTSSLTLGQKVFGFFINVPMIASIIYMGYITSRFIE